MHACADRVLVSMHGCANQLIELVVGVIAKGCERQLCDGQLLLYNIVHTRSELVNHGSGKSNFSPRKPLQNQSYNLGTPNSMDIIKPFLLI